MRAILTQPSGSVFTMPEAGAAWPVYVSFMPDGTGVKNDIAAIYDTEGMVTHRLLASKKNIESYGLQIKTRSYEYRDGYRLLSEQATNLSKISRFIVFVESTQYIIDTVKQTSPIIPMPQDEERRSFFVLNVLLSLIEAP